MTYYLSTQVLNPKSDDHLDYADADYKDLYAEGPLGYKAASKKAKEGKRLWIVILEGVIFISMYDVLFFNLFSLWTICGLIKESKSYLHVGLQSIFMCVVLHESSQNKA